MAHGQRRNATLTIIRKSKTLAVQQTIYGPVDCYIGDPSGLTTQSQFLAATGLIQGASSDVTDQVLFDVPRSHALLLIQENDELIITQSDNHKDGTYYVKGTERPTTPANRALPAKYRIYARRKPD